MAEYSLDGNTLCVHLSGRIDSANAPTVEQTLNDTIHSVAHDALTLNLGTLEYISSAGLRVILRLRKEEPTLKLVNVHNEVYEILEMTGFTEMLPVEKAFRELNVDGCVCIGSGYSGDVYRLDDDIIVKVYKRADALPDIQRERNLARRAFILGIPTAIPFDVVRVGDKYGSVFELLKAKSFGEMMIENPDEVDKCIDLTVSLMQKIHSTKVDDPDIPSAHEIKGLPVADFMDTHLPPEQAQKFRRMVEEIPDSSKMIHGDLHIKNIMMQNGEVLLIDMDTLSHGHPIYELKAQFEAYIGYGILDKTNSMQFFGIPMETSEYLFRETLSRYLELTDPDALKKVENKIALFGYASLYAMFAGGNPNPEGEEKQLQEAYRSEVLRLLDIVDSFLF